MRFAKIIPSVELHKVELVTIGEQRYFIARADAERIFYRLRADAVDG